VLFKELKNSQNHLPPAPEDPTPADNPAPVPPRFAPEAMPAPPAPTPAFNPAPDVPPAPPEAPAPLVPAAGPVVVVVVITVGPLVGATPTTLLGAALDETAAPLLVGALMNPGRKLL